MNKPTLIALVASAFAVSLAANVSLAADTSITSTSTTTTVKHKGDGHLLKELGLTKDQIKSIRAIRATTKAKVESIKSNTTLSEADKKAQIKAAHKESRTQIEAILTPDQIAKLKQLREARRDERKDKATEE